MNKYFYILIFIIFNFTAIYPGQKPDFTTILIIIEEQENNLFVTETTPFSDGIFNALWKKEYIFFDMKIDKPVRVITDQLDVKQYFPIARESGADSLLVIKFHYSFVRQPDKKYLLNTDNTMYNLYSLNSMKSFASGQIRTSSKETLDTSEDKDKFLKQAGADMLDEIFSKLE
jgi:hypothetical protein